MLFRSHGVALRQPVVEASGECRHSNEIFIELGKRLVPDYFQFENDIAYYDIQLAGLGLSIEKLREMGGLWSPHTMGFRKYKKAGGFGTPSGKIHLHWEELEASPWNQNWPRVELAPEYRVKTEEFPFILISYRSIYHSGSGQWSHNNPQLRDRISGLHENPLMMNTTTAAKLGISQGDTVTVASSSGSIQVKVNQTLHTNAKNTN